MADRTRINLSEETEVLYWSERVGLTPERLREVVNEVGNSVERVREKLGWQKPAMMEQVAAGESIGNLS